MKLSDQNIDEVIDTIEYVTKRLRRYKNKEVK